MNFNQLRYIVAVDKHRNFADAAAECEVAQSTLSKEVQRLEQEFGILIFDRTRRPVAPTMKGADLVQQAKEILAAQRHFIDTALKTDNRPAGDFRLGILPMLAPYLLPLFIRALSRKYPELTVEILELTEEEMLDRFKRDELDGAISIAPFIEAGFYEDILFEEAFVLYADRDHPLLAHETVRWGDIPVDELILHRSIRKHLLSSEALAGSRPALGRASGNMEYESGSLETIRKIIDRNGGITLLPELSTLYMGGRRLRMVRPIVDPVLSRSIMLVTPRGFEKKRITKAIRKEILAGLPAGDRLP